MISLADYENEGLAWDYNSAGVNHPFRRRIAVLLPELRGHEYWWHFDHVSLTGRLGKMLALLERRVDKAIAVAEGTHNLVGGW